MSCTNNNISIYNKNSGTFFSQYQSVSFDDVHSAWVKTINFNQCKTALDIGAGSGRDAFALSKKNLSVSAVEPSKELRTLGKSYTADSVQWFDDSLPKLKKIVEKTFDIILVSAVWMHLSPDEQSQSIKTISTLLNAGGYLIITLRHGDFLDGRIAFQLDANRIIAEAKQHGLSLILSKNEGDKLSRDDVSWHTLCFKA